MIDTLTVLLPVLILGSAILHVRAEYRGPRYHVYLFKPLTTSLILLIALLKAEPITPFYQCAIVAGLACSLAGDVFLMLPGDRFIAGLVSFLVAHLCYIVAFSSDAGFGFSIWLLTPCLVYAMVLLRILLPHTGKMKLPVLVYGFVITTMAWRALERWARLEGSREFLAFLGAALFVISDSALAVDRFVHKYKSARLVILSTYFTAQWLIALSV